MRSCGGWTPSGRTGSPSAMKSASSGLWRSGTRPARPSPTTTSAPPAASPPGTAPCGIGLDFAERPDLWARIDARVDEMMDRGLEGEVRRLLSAGVPEGCTAMQAIGYKEFAAALRGEEPLSDAVEEVKLRSRQYAKRQLTWFRRNRDTNWIFWEKSPDLAAARQKATAFLEDLGLSVAWAFPNREIRSVHRLCRTKSISRTTFSPAPAGAS